MSKKLADYIEPVFKEKRPKKNKPNVMILMTDQQRYDTIRELGYTHMITPNMDRLVKEGCAFTNAMTPNPVCIPARLSILCGVYSNKHGAPDLRGTVAPTFLPRIPVLLAENGYHCEAIGKMHFTPPLTPHGFHRRKTQEELCKNIEDDDYAMYLRSVGMGHIRNIHGIRNLLYHQPQRSLLPEKHHPTTWVGDQTVEAVRRNKNRPFFIWASWIHPHPPVAVPENYANKYKKADIPKPTPMEEDANPKLIKQRLGDDYKDDKKTRRFRELYYAAITLVDKNIGKVLKALEQTGQIDNTLIIFTTDHGEMMGDNGAWAKELPNDPSSRIPLVLRMPSRVKANLRRDDFADLVDIFPTILDACGIENPKGLAGESLLIKKGKGKKRRDEHFMEYGEGEKRVVSLRTDDYKYNFWFGGGLEELYDMKNDPGEINNLLKGKMTREQKKVYTRLKKRLAVNEQKFGLPGTVKNGKLVAWKGKKKTAWPPEKLGLNWQFPNHPYNMSKKEQKKYQSNMEEILKATKKEPTLDISKLNMDYYKSCTGE